MMQKRCLSSPLYSVEERMMRLDSVVKRFSAAANLAVTRADRRLATAAGKLHVLSPLQVISRGYALVQNEDGVVRSVQGVEPDDTVSVRLTDGVLQCRVTEKEVLS
jgi:exodeoxyribonuclease VII large subunit